MTYEEVWQSYEPEHPKPSFEEIEEAARRFDRTVKRRNWTELAAVAFLVPTMAAIAVVPSPIPMLSRASAGFLMAVTVFIGWAMLRYGRLRELPDPAQSTHAFIAAQRARLLDQARFLKYVPYWYVAPIALGTVGFYVGFGLAAPAPWTAFLARFWHILLVTFAFYGFVAVLNVRVSRKLELEAEALANH